MAHTVWALIKDGVIVNLALGSYYDVSRIGIVTYGEGTVAIEVTQYPVKIGDTYEDGKFYTMEGETKVEVERIPTEAETVAEHTNELASHDSDIDELWVAILEG